MAYYETVAQVIAIILLALAFEARAFDKVRTYPSGEPNPFSAITMLFLLVLLVLGELAALFALAEGRDTGLAKAVTAMAVVCGGIGVIAPLWKRQRDATRGADRSTWLDALILFSALGIGVATLLMLLAG